MTSETHDVPQCLRTVVYTLRDELMISKPIEVSHLLYFFWGNIKNVWQEYMYSPLSYGNKTRVTFI